METFKGHSFHTSRWDYELHRRRTSRTSRDKVVGIIGTGATRRAGRARTSAQTAKELYVFQRTPSSIDIRDDWETDPEWAAKLQAGLAGEAAGEGDDRAAADRDADRASAAAMTREEKIRRQENANIDYMMRIHRRIDEIVEDPATAEALKPWYMFMCKRPCFHNDYLPTFNRPERPPRRHPRQGHHRDRPQGPDLRRQRVRARRADLRHRVRGAEDRHLQPDRRRARRRAATTSTPTASARCSASTPTASRTCSSWAATRRRSSST